MKHALLISAFCLWCLSGHAQNDAFAAFHAGDYRTAIKRYQANIAQKATQYDWYMLALSYQKADSLPQAKREFEKVVNASEKDLMGDGRRMEACDALARLYQGEKNYEEALYYFQLFRSIFEKAVFNDVNRTRIRFFNADNQAKCFAPLGKTDSAIRVLTPYMFYPYKALDQLGIAWQGSGDQQDSLKHDTVSRFYLSLLQKRYSKAQIKTEFQKSEQGFTFIEYRSAPDAHGVIWENMKCTIRIYDTDIVVIQEDFGDMAAKLLKEVDQPYYTKAYQLEQFRQLPICRMVRNL
jgi:tetratricopeptide (TPR) repeat protein